MRFAICYSKKDMAGVNIINKFKEVSFSPQTPIIELKKETIFSDDLIVKNYPELKEIDFLIFASKHESVKKEKSLCLHAPGNWRNSDLGGKSGKICKTSAFILKYLFRELNKNAKILDEYNITLECTHHGPLIEIPCCFIEIGSSEQEWNDKSAALAIVKTILSLKDFKKNPNWASAIGIGGPHYCPNFNKIQLNSDYAIGHIIPEYSLPLTKNMLEEAEEKTIEQTEYVILDWKGCGKSEERNKVLEVLKESNIKYKKTSSIEK
jgi:D-aminoacyl-tRNA deacylase